MSLGILAHVDAGKTTLTERLLYEAGVIDVIGSVDAGTTQTDSLALERQRGITIKSAVASFALEDVHVNLIDTPGHPDFIAEVERVLNVLDGAVLVISAVEAVQPQTRILMRALQRLRIPTLMFVNKIDRPGAGDERVLQAVSERLTSAIVPMGTADALGTRSASFTLFGAGDPPFRSKLAEALAERDDGILASFVEDQSGLPYRRLREELASQTKQVLVHPLFFGSALTGAGLGPLMAGIVELLPSSPGDPDGPVSATTFKIERGRSGEKIAYARMFSGTIRTRDRLRFGAGLEDKVTNIAVFERGPAVQRPSVSAGAVAMLWGLDEIRIGDRIGGLGTDTTHHFAPPTLESVVVARNLDDRARLRVALGELAEQDPLIDVRQDDARHEISVSLYGEVQKQVIGATLAGDYGIDVEFQETTTVYIERPVGTGEVVEVLHAKTKTNVTGKSSPTSSNPFLATVGLRVDPAPIGSGIEFRLDIDVRLVPIYIYKTVAAFIDLMAKYVREALREGLFGWQVTDCTVTVTECGYRAPGSTAADFRKLILPVLMQALQRAGTVVCEPVVRVRLEIPADSIGTVMAALGRLGVTVETQSVRGNLSTIQAVLPDAQAHDLQRQLSGLTGGEGLLESSFVGYQPVNDDPPTRRRTTANPLNRDEYMMHLVRGRSG
ncbi:MAG: TetM/TetW/TetO/TetS family tetracycline resistance ribosomal protection protein [Actinobacteria bacterium]|nr:TetM/TetW/TetO/TetS family tetracycline resistance ribosomal protection protein [Actinomycetota bacterium]